MAIGYFGRFRTISSFYWENMTGDRAAAAILASPSDDTARALIQARGITHVASIAADNFLPHLFELAPPSSRAKTLDGAFGYRLLDPRHAPRWLRPIPFHPRFPDQTDTRAFLYQVVPDQTELDALWNVAIAELAAGNVDDAAGEFERAASTANTSRRPELYQTAGRIAYQSGAHRLAVQLLDSAMRLRPSRDLAANIAWIRATSSDASVRNGQAALVTAQRLTGEDPNDMMALDVLGAALAEMGRFAEAVGVAERMLGVARGHGDIAGEQRAATRLRAYRAGQPWRQ
jgi:tetratricopeptide (TPR) repeat protein